MIKLSDCHAREGGYPSQLKSARCSCTHTGFLTGKLLRNASGITCFLLLLVSPASVAYADFCDNVNHVARDDVTYKPSPNVVPADINAVPIALGDIEIPLTAYLVQRLGLNVPVTSSKLGSIIIKENGQVVYNGKDISSNAKSVCEQQKVEVQQKEKATKVQKNINEDRQAKVEAVKSAPLDVYTEETLYGGYGQEHINKSYND